MSGCSVEGCDNKHYAQGLCRKHYVKKRRQDKEEGEETKEADNEPKFIPPTEVKIGVPGTPPEGSTTPVQAPKLGPDGKPLPGQPGGYSFSFGTLQVELAWEQLSRLAPEATPLRLTPKQREELDRAFEAAGITVNNPWVVIIGIIVPPTVLFVIINYEQIRLNLDKMLKDLTRTVAGLRGKKQAEPEKMV